MWKDLFDKGKCLLGFHEGAWRYRGARTCTQVQTCVRCGNTTERVEHQWADWGYERDGQCDQIRRCQRCGAVERQVTHSWGEPHYARADACDRIAVCARCREPQALDVVHVFDTWSYQTADSCSQVVTCSRCSVTGAPTRVEHDWGAWTRSAFYETNVRVCRHCGEMLLDARVSGGGRPVAMQAIDADVNRVIAADTAPQIRAILTQAHSTLLTPAADKYFAFAFDQYADDAFRRGPLTAARTLVTRCQANGIDATLQELGLEAPLPTPMVTHSPTPGTPAQRKPASRRNAAGPLDKRLIGHWTNTEFLGQGTPMMMSIESHCVLDGSGRFEFVVQGNDVEAGTWTAGGGELVMRFDGGDSFVRSYIVDSSGMIWNNDSRFHFWRRVG